MPNGNPYPGNPVDGPTSITLNNGQTAQVVVTRNVPGRAPNGVYTVAGYIGQYPGDVSDADSFTFTKLAAASVAGEPVVVDEAAAWTPVEGQATAALTVTEAPVEAELLGAFPNPFNRSATIAYSVGDRTEVELAVYNSLGQRVAVLAQGTVEAGRHEAVLDGASLPSGVYLYRLQTGGQFQTGRLMLVR